MCRPLHLWYVLWTGLHCWVILGLPYLSGPSSAGCNVAIHDLTVWKPSLSYTCLRMGEWRGGGKGAKGRQSHPDQLPEALLWIPVTYYFRVIQQVAALIGADPREIIFTSGATESNNMAIKACWKWSMHFKELYAVIACLINSTQGVAKFYKAKKKHIITTQTVSVHY